MTDSPSSRDSRMQTAAQVARYLTALLLVTMFIGTHIPVETPPPLAPPDKLLHVVAYMVLTVAILTSWELSAGELQPQHYFAVWLFGTLYGAFDEITQIPVGRHCDGMDWLADVAGIVIGLVCYRLGRLLLVSRQEVAIDQ